MKKFIKLTLCAFLFCLVVGCGKITIGGNETTTGGNETVTEEETVVESSALQSFVDENASTVQNMSTSLFTADLLARDNSLVYSFQYTTTYDSSMIASMKTSLDNSLNNNETTYQNVLTAVKKVAPETKSVIVEYLNGDGTIISSKEYK